MGYNYEELAKLYAKNIHKFTYNRAKYLEFNGYTVDNETRRQIRDDYTILIAESEAYMRKKYPKGFTQIEQEYTFSLDDMAASLSEDSAPFIKDPSIDCTVKPVGEDSEALIQFENGFVKEAYKMETIKKIPRYYRTPMFNKALEGQSILDVRNMLMEFGVLPLDNILDMVMAEHDMRIDERYDFFETLITRLLLNANEEDEVRAHMLDYFLGINFDFESYKANERTK